MNKMIVRCLVGLLCLIGWQQAAQAAQTFTVTLTTAPAEFDMGSTMAATWVIKNTTTTGLYTNDTIKVVRFRTNNGNAIMSVTAPAGWTVSYASGCCSGGFQSVTLTTTYANGISPGASLAFPMQMKFRTTSADATNQHLRDVRSTFSSSGGATNNITVNSFSAAGNNVWTLRSLVITLTPSASSIGLNCLFTLTMNVTNKSTSNITTVTANPNPPNKPTVNSLSGGATATTSTSPSIASLAANGGSGNLVWNYIAGGNAGTISFTAAARDSTGTRTSRSITTPNPTVTIGSAVTCGFIASFNATTPACLYSGATATFTMQVSNTIAPATPLTNVQPSTPVNSGSASINSLSAPNPASIPSLNSGTSGPFAWTAQVSGNTGATVMVTAHANGTDPLFNVRQSNDATSPSVTLNGYPVSVSPSAVNASSTNWEVTWVVTNSGCNPVTKVSIPIPTNWTWTGMAYALVNGVNEDWTAAQVGSSIVFTSGTQMPTGSSGAYSLTFNMPAATSGPTSYNLTVTDSASLVKASDSYTIEVDPFDTSSTGSNNTNPGMWREIFK